MERRTTWLLAETERLGLRNVTVLRARAEDAVEAGEARSRTTTSARWSSAATPEQRRHAHSMWTFDGSISARGGLGSISSNARRTIDEIDQFRYHLLSAGTTNHGACSVEHRESASVYAS